MYSVMVALKMYQWTSKDMVLHCPSVIVRQSLLISLIKVDMRLLCPICELNHISYFGLKFEFS